MSGVVLDDEGVGAFLGNIDGDRELARIVDMSG